jgi:AcrR family transcriptional regulator
MERLPRGKRGLPPEFSSQNQRSRLIAAVTACVHEEDYSETTVGEITARARISKADFYKHFENKEAAILAAYDEAVERMREVVLLACAREEDWGDGVCAAISALLDHLVSEPAAADLVLVEGLNGGREFHNRYQGAVRRFAPYLRDRAPAPVGGGQLPEGADEAVVGGIASLLGRHVIAGEGDRLGQFFPEIAEFALSPYVGLDEARRIISAA